MKIKSDLYQDPNARVVLEISSKHLHLSYPTCFFKYNNKWQSKPIQFLLGPKCICGLRKLVRNTCIYPIKNFFFVKRKFFPVFRYYTWPFLCRCKNRKTKKNKAWQDRLFMSQSYKLFSDIFSILVIKLGHFFVVELFSYITK